MKEQLISFETAKLAKEKGFFYKTPKYYPTENPHSIHKDVEGVGILGTLHEDTLYQKYTKIHEESGLLEYQIATMISAPTQSILQKWLRDSHAINVESNYLPNIEKFRCLYKPMHIQGAHFKNPKEYEKNVGKYYSTLNHNTYEKALEEGLKEALLLL